MKERKTGDWLRSAAIFCAAAIGIGSTTPARADVDYTKWNYANDVLTWTSSVADMGGAAEFTVFDRSTGANTANTYTGNVSTAYNNVTELFWHSFCYSNNGGDAYTAPGLVLRLSGTAACSTIGGTFGPFALGGLIVEDGATGYAMTQTGSDRTTVWGDPSATTPTYFLINEDFSLDRNGPFFLSGTVNIEVAQGKALTIAQAATTSGAIAKPSNAGGIANNATAGGVLRLSGGGTVSFTGGLTVNGGTLDYAGATISGNVTLSAGSTIVLPAGTATDETISAAVCTGTLTVPTTALMNVKIGDSEPVAALLTVSNGAITKIDTQLEKTFTSGYPAIVPAGCTYTYEGSGDSANPSNITSLAVYGTLRTKGQFNITGASSELNSTIEVVDGNTKLNSANTQTLKGNIVIDAGATLTNMRTSDAIQYSNSRTIDIYGTLAMGSTRWTVGGNTAINIHGGTITGAGEGSNGALDFIDTFSSSVSVVDDDTTIAANLRFRKTGVVFTVAEDKTLTCTGLMNQNGTKQVGSFAKQGTGKMVLTTAPTFTQTITLAAGTLNVGSLTLAAPIAATGTATVETTETIAVSSVSSGATLTVAGGNATLGTVRPEGAIVFTGTGNTLSTTFASTDETSYTLNVSGVDVANVTVYKAGGSVVDANATKTYNANEDELTIAVAAYAIPTETTETTLAELGIPATGNVTITSDHDATINLGSADLADYAALTVATTGDATITFVSDSVLTTAIAGAGYQILYDIYKLRNAEPHPAITAPSGQTVCITNSCTVTDQAAEGYYDGTYTNTVTAAGTVKMLADAKLTSFSVPEGGTLEIVSGTTTLSKSSKAISGTLTVDVGATCAFSRTDIINYSGSPYINVYGTIDGGTSRQSVGDGAHLTFYTGSRVVGNGDGSNPYNSTIDLCGSNADTRFALAEGVQEGTVTLACPWEFRGGKTNKWTIDSGVTVDWAGHEGKCVKASGGQGTFIVEGSGTLNLGGTMSSNAAITMNGGTLNVTESVPVNVIIAKASGVSFTVADGVTASGNLTLGSTTAGGFIAPGSALVTLLKNSSKWTGAVNIPNVNRTDASSAQQIPLHNYGNAESTIALAGTTSVNNWIGSGNPTINANVAVNGATVFDNGASGNTYTFAGGLSGTGDLTVGTWATCKNSETSGETAYLTYAFNKIEGYSGTIVASAASTWGVQGSLKVSIGDVVATEAYDTPLVRLAKTGVNSGNTLVDIASTTVNGESKTLVYDDTVSGSEGVYLAAAEYGGVKYARVSQAVAVAEADSEGEGLPGVKVLSESADHTGFDLAQNDDYWTLVDCREAVWQPGPESDQRWNTAANWSINHVPLASTKVYITGGENEYTKIWITGYSEPTTETCAGIVMSGLVELAPVNENGASSYPRLSVGGDIELANGATGTLRLFRAGLHNTCGGTTAITVKPDFLGNGQNNSDRDSYLDNGPFVFDGNVTAQGKLRLFVNATFNGDVVVKENSTIQGESSYTQTYNGDLTVHGGLKTTGAMVAEGKTVFEYGSDSNAWITVGTGGATFNGDFEIATAMIVQTPTNLTVNGAATIGAKFTKRGVGAMTFANVTIADSAAGAEIEGEAAGPVAVNGTVTIANGVEWTLPTNLTYGDDVAFVLAGMRSKATVVDALHGTITDAKFSPGIDNATVSETSGENCYIYSLVSDGVFVDIDGCDFIVDDTTAAAVTAATGVAAGDTQAFKKASIAYVLGGTLVNGEVVLSPATIAIDGSSVMIELALADSQAASFAITARLQGASSLASPIAWTDVAEGEGVTPSETLSGADKTANLVDVKTASRKFYRVVVTISDMAL